MEEEGEGEGMSKETNTVYTHTHTHILNRCIIPICKEGKKPLSFVIGVSVVTKPPLPDITMGLLPRLHISAQSSREVGRAEGAKRYRRFSRREVQGTYRCQEPLLK